jgi:hypothetical protein
MVLVAKTKTKTTRRKTSVLEMDSLFIFKLVLFLILGSQWLYIVDRTGSYQLPIPVGAIIGLAFAMHDHFKIDRKIEYALLLVSMFIGFWLPMGIKLVR